MNKYRTHTCGELTKKDKNKNVFLSGWINKKRDHGNLLFIDLRDNYGLTQCVIDNKNNYFKDLEKIQLESVIKVEGIVIERDNDTIAPNIPSIFGIYLLYSPSPNRLTNIEKAVP